MPRFYFDVPGVRNATVTADTEEQARAILEQNAPTAVQWGEFDATGPDSVALIDTDLDPPASNPHRSASRPFSSPERRHTTVTVTRAQLIAAETALRADDTDEATWPTGAQVEAIIEAAGLTTTVQGVTPRVFIDLATTVLPRSEMQNITEAPPTVITHEYGAWVHVPPQEADDDQLSTQHDEQWATFPHLLSVLLFARSLGADWVHFDTDGHDMRIDGYPTFDR